MSAHKSCPFCGEDILQTAIICRYCRSQVDGNAPTQRLVSLFEGTPMELRQRIAYAGAAMLIMGTFAPIATAPIVGSINYFQNGRGDGVFLIFLGVVCIYLAYKELFRPIWYAGLASSVILLIDFGRFHKVMATLDDNSWIGGLARASVGLSWGYFVMCLATALLLVSALLWRRPKAISSRGYESALGDFGFTEALPLFKRPLVVVIALFAPVLLIWSLAYSGLPATSSNGSSAPALAASSSAAGYSSTPRATGPRANAVRSAKAYLATSSFSRLGLIDQLGYEGYSTATATTAVNSLNVDWNAQAALSARNYLNMSGFSCSGLIDQLMYEQYTRSQAKYGARRAAAC